MENQKEIYTLKELAVYLNLSPRTLYQKTHKKTIPHYKVGGVIFFRLDNILKWIEEHRVPTIDQLN